MKKISGVIKLLQAVVKYGAYVMAVIEIVEFAIKTIQAIKDKDDDNEEEKEQ